MSLTRSTAIRLACSWVLATVSVWASACNNPDPIPVFVDLDYQLYCVVPQCAGPHGAPRKVQAVDGEDSFVNSCQSRRSDGQTQVTLSARRGNSQLFEIANAVPGDDTTVGSSCRVRIIDGDNTYIGACSHLPPSINAPCQITGFRKNSNGLLEGNVYCDDIPVPTAPGITRDVALSGTNPAARTPARFLADPCEGL